MSRKEILEIVGIAALTFFALLVLCAIFGCIGYFLAYFIDHIN